MDAVEPPTLISSSSGWFIIVIFYGRYQARGRGGRIVIATTTIVLSSGVRRTSCREFAVWREQFVIWNFSSPIFQAGHYMGVLVIFRQSVYRQSVLRTSPKHKTPYAFINSFLRVSGCCRVVCWFVVVCRCSVVPGSNPAVVRTLPHVKK